MGNVSDRSSEVNKIHEHSDVDGSKVSQHHTLGPGANQASPGDHNHNGVSSRVVASLTGVAFTGSRNTDAWRQQVMAALVALGATNSTTA